MKTTEPLNPFEKIKLIVMDFIDMKIRSVKSYIRKQVLFAVSLLLGLFFLLLSLAEYLVTVIPHMSRALVLFLMGLVIIGLGYIQRALKFKRK